MTYQNHKVLRSFSIFLRETVKAQVWWILSMEACCDYPQQFWRKAPEHRDDGLEALDTIVCASGGQFSVSPRSIESPHYNPIWHWNRKCFITIPQCPSSSLSVYGWWVLNSGRKKRKGEDSLNSWLRRWCHCSSSSRSSGLLDSSEAELEELRYSLLVLVRLWSELILFRPIKVFFEWSYNNRICNLRQITCSVLSILTLWIFFLWIMLFHYYALRRFNGAW